MPIRRRARFLRRAAGAFVAALSGCALGTGVEPDVPPQSASLLFGPRTLDDSWAPGEDQLAFGALIEFHRPDDGRGFEFGALRGTDDGGGNLDSAVEEFFLGAHAESRPLPVGTLALIFWAGTGVSWLQGETDSGTDSELGAYAQGGLRVWLGGGTSLGLGLRWANSDDLTIDGVRLDTTYLQGLLVFGWHF